VAYGLTSSLRGDDWLQVVQVVGIAFVESRLRVVHRRRLLLPAGTGGPYSIQTLKRLRPALFRQDLIALFDLLQQKKIKPLIARRFPFAEARHAHELLGKGRDSKIVLVPDGSSLSQERRNNGMQRHLGPAEHDRLTERAVIFMHDEVDRRSGVLVPG